MANEAVLCDKSGRPLIVELPNGDLQISPQAVDGAVLMTALSLNADGALAFKVQDSGGQGYYTDFSNTINFNRGENADASDGWVNYNGYLGGTTKFRNFNVGNGKRTSLASFSGINNRMSLSNTVRLRCFPIVFANVPATPLEGDIMAFTDSNTATWGATIAGGGANHVLGYYNGTVWTVMAK